MGRQFLFHRESCCCTATTNGPPSAWSDEAGRTRLFSKLSLLARWACSSGSRSVVSSELPANWLTGLTCIAGAQMVHTIVQLHTPGSITKLQGNKGVSDGSISYFAEVFAREKPALSRRRCRASDREMAPYRRRSRRCLHRRWRQPPGWLRNMLIAMFTLRGTNRYAVAQHLRHAE